MSEFQRNPEIVKPMQERENLPQTPEKDFELDLTVERLKRHLEIADLIEELESDGELGFEKRKKIASIIEGRGWNTLFKSLEKGQNDIAVFIVPAGAYAIKNLNDKIFGPQGADDIIEHQKMFLRNVMEAYGFDCLKQDYKTSVFKVNGATDDVLDMISATVQAQLDLYVQQKVKIYKKQNQSKGESVEHLDNFRQAVKDGYKLSYGKSSITNGTFEDVERVVLEGTQKAKKSQREKNKEGEYGGTYDAKEIVSTSERTQLIRNFILDNYNNSVFDTVDGQLYIFEEPKHDGQFVLNRYVLRALRKGTLKPATERDAKVLELLNEYKQIINLLDSVKPFTHDEVVGEASSGFSVRDQWMEERAIAKEIVMSDIVLENTSRKKAAAILRRDQKDGNCASPAVFHRTAIETVPNCTYISIDVLDVGVDLLLEYEQLYMTVEQASPQDKERHLKRAMVQAGDKKTLELRAIRERVRSYCEEKFKKAVPMLVGGDEITLALPSELVDEDFLFGLRTASGSRVVTSEVERAKTSDNSEGNKEELYRLHAMAIKEGEAAIGVAKKIEDLITVREHIGVPKEMGKDGDSQADPALTALISELKKGFVVKEEHGLFYLVLKGEELPLSVDHDRISVTKAGNKMFIYGAALMLLLAFFAFK